MKKTIIQIICCLLVVALAFGISWLIGKGIPPNADAGPPTQIEHTHSFGDWQITKEATCSETGTEMRTCECGYFEERALAALGHDYVDGKCSRCGEVDPEYVPPCGHSSERKEITLEATCTEPGKVKIYCEECGELLREEIIPANGHKFGNWQTTKEATCTTSGTKTRVCQNCSKKQSETIAALGHQYVNDQCSRCGKYNPSVYPLTVTMKYKSGEYVVDDPNGQRTYAKLVWQSGSGTSGMIGSNGMYFVAEFIRNGQTLTIGDTAKVDTLFTPVVYTVSSTAMDLRSEYNSYFVNGKYTVQFKFIVGGKTYRSNKLEFDYNRNNAYWFTVSAND